MTWAQQPKKHNWAGAITRPDTDGRTAIIPGGFQRPSFMMACGSLNE
jgi:hypothetical protein